MKSKLSPMEWRLLNLVNENEGVTPGTLCHLLYGNQSALPRTKSMLQKFDDEALIFIIDRKVIISICGKTELLLQKPLKPLS